MMKRRTLYAKLKAVEEENIRLIQDHKHLNESYLRLRKMYSDREETMLNMRRAASEVIGSCFNQLRWHQNTKMIKPSSGWDTRNYACHECRGHGGKAVGGGPHGTVTQYANQKACVDDWCEECYGLSWNMDTRQTLSLKSKP